MLSIVQTGAIAGMGPALNHAARYLSNQNNSTSVWVKDFQAWLYDQYRIRISPYKVYGLDGQPGWYWEMLSYDDEEKFIMFKLTHA